MKLNRNLLVAIAAVDSLLALLAVYCFLQGWVVLAIVLFVAGGLLVASFIVVSAALNNRQQQHPFEAAMSQAGLTLRDNESVDQTALAVLQRFVEIGNIASIGKLHAGQTQAGPVFAGSYRLQSSNVSSGYFLAAILNLRDDPNLTLAKLIKAPQEFDMALQLNIRETPDDVQSALDRFPYKSHCVENFVLLMFNEDDVRASDFATTVHEVIAALRGRLA